ncbi:MAG: SCP2 sterol-binding domain-containing protein [Anaerolineae bacterium]|nr:SCP2 sterol-binding domain-containing protein [Anaerolineae bacterium]
MGIPFPSNEWVEALMVKINESEAYRSAARTWEGDFYFIVDPEGSVTEPVIMYMDLWHGQCREAFIARDESVKNPEFRINAPVSAWKQVITKQLDPIQALMTRRLKLQGNMMKIMRAVKAAQELVNCCTQVPTEFPD